MTTDRPNLTLPALLLGLSLALGLTVAGFLVAGAVHEVRAADRFVTVKGLSEREVPADLALSPIVFTNTGDDLSELQGAVERNADSIRAFLGHLGFEDTETSLSAPRITPR